MLHENPKKLFRMTVVALLAAVPFVAACSEADEGKKPGHGEPSTPDVTAPRYLPYAIRFKLDGKPVVVDEKGELIKLVEVKPPLKATALVGVQSISVVTYEGSCKQIYNIGGKLFEVTLPDAYCQK